MKDPRASELFLKKNHTNTLIKIKLKGDILTNSGSEVVELFT